MNCLTVPYKYQLEDAWTIHGFRGRCLLSSEMGTGKTLVSLLFAAQRTDLRPIVVACPASLKLNWSRECQKHFGWRSVILEGKKAYACNSRTGIYIINYDILPDWLDCLEGLKPGLVILDECGSYLGNQSTKRTRAVRKLCMQIPAVLGLSGTPLVNRPAELWPTLNILRPDLFDRFWPFAMRFCAPKRIPWGNGWDFRGASNLEELHAILKSELMIRRKKSEVLKDLPEKQRHVLPLPLVREGEYTKAHRDFIAWLAENSPEKVPAALRAQRLVRINALKMLAAQLKLPAACDWIDSFLKESDGKLILFGIHKEILGKLQARYARLCVVVDGSTPSKHRLALVDQFQAQKKTRVFLGQIRAAGVGLNLTAASTVAFVECDWTPGAHTQAEDRAHRLGTKNAVNCYYLVAYNTIEDYLARILEEKQRTLTAVLDGGEGEELDVFNRLQDALLQQRTSKGRKA